MVSSTSKLNDNEYTKLLQDVGFEPAGWGKIAAYLMQKGVNQMYHALVHEDDIVNLFNIPNLTIFWTCRCHHVAEDCSTCVEAQVSVHSALVPELHILIVMKFFFDEIKFL